MTPFDESGEFKCDETCIIYDAGVEVSRCKHYGKCPVTAGIEGD